MRSSILVTLFALAASPVFAHGGGPHLKGTVAALSAGQITVKALDGHEDEAMITAGTVFLHGDAAGKQDDLKQGDRVVVHTRKHGAVLEAVQIHYGGRAKAGHK